jgi:hypothetical protein
LDPSVKYFYSPAIRIIDAFDLEQRDPYAGFVKAELLRAAM